MRIIIELTAEESAAREKWLAHEDRHTYASLVEAYDVRWARVADAALLAVTRIQTETDFRNTLAREIFPEGAPKLACEGVDLYYSGEFFDKDPRIGAVPYRYTLAGKLR